MNSRLKMVSFTMLFALLLPLCAACSDSSVSQDTVTKANDTAAVTAAVTTEELSQYELRQRIADDLPEKDFNGKSFRVATASDKEFEIYVEELTGTNTLDAIYNRNAAIGDRFNISIESVILTTPYEDVKTHVLAGDNAYEIVGFFNYMVYTPVSAGVLSNWLDVPYLNLEKPWHNKAANDGATINGKLFAINSDLSITSLLYTYAMFFNAAIAGDFGYSADSLYDLVFSGEWTVDKFYEITSGIHVDVNGDGVKDKDDINGYVFFPGLNTTDVWLAALDLSVTDKTEDGWLTAAFYNEKSMEAIEKVINLCYNNDGCYVHKVDWRDVPNIFANGNAAFSQLYFGEAFDVLGEMDDTYGILPLPKWDTAQTEYYTNAWDQFSVFGIPMTSVDYEFIGIIYEALCAESYKTVYPQYYDVALKSRYSSDPSVAEIVDLIMAGRKFEFSFQFGEMLSSLPYMFRQLLAAEDPNLASKYTKIEKVLNKTIQKVNGYYE